MDSKLTRRALLGAGLALPLLHGCGGGSGTSSLSGGTDPTRGTLTLTVNWPTSRKSGPGTTTGGSTYPSSGYPSSSGYSGYSSSSSNGPIPTGARSLLVALLDPSDGSALAPSKLILAPSPPGTNQPPVTVQFTNVRVGPVKLVATVFANNSGVQSPTSGAIANGSASGIVTAGSTLTLFVPFTLTIAHLTARKSSVYVSPATAAVNHSVDVSVTAVDNQGNYLQYPLTWYSANPTIATVTYDPADPGHALITGVSDGTTYVTATEPNSGLTTTINVSSFLSQ